MVLHHFTSPYVRVFIYQESLDETKTFTYVRLQKKTHNHRTGLTGCPPNACRCEPPRFWQLANSFSVTRCSGLAPVQLFDRRSVPALRSRHTMSLLQIVDQTIQGWANQHIFETISYHFHGLRKYAKVHVGRENDQTDF